MMPSSGEANSERPSTAELGTPLHFMSGETTASSSTCSSNLPFQSTSSSSTGDLPELTSRLTIGLPHVALHQENMSRLLPGEMTPPLDNKGFIVGVHKTFTVSKRMQLAFGLQNGVTPYTRPPRVPDNLIEVFECGLKEYGEDWHEDCDQLKEIKEESLQDGKTQANEDDEQQKHGNPRQIVSNGGIEGPFFPEPKIPASRNGKQRRDAPNPKKVRFQDSLETQVGVISATGQYARKHSDFPEHHNTHKEGLDTNSAGFAHVNSSQQHFPLKTESIFHYDDFHFTGTETGSLFPRPTSSTKVYCPFITASISASLSLHPRPSGFFSTLCNGPQDLPHIPGVDPNSIPERSRKRRKRESIDHTRAESIFSRSASSFSLPRPAKKKVRHEPVPTSLPALSRSDAAEWKTPFLGNTEGLSYTLLTWHATMRSLHHKLDNPYLLQVHPMFPYPPTKPTHIPLVSASFWDTTTQPNQELRFIGPGDVEVLCYNEVDTFGTMSEKTDDISMRRSVSGLKTKLKGEACKTKETGDKAFTGEGRWCFIVIRGHPSKDQQVTKHPASIILEEDEGEKEKEGQREKEVSPYVVLAFPSTAVSRSSECLHIIYPHKSGVLSTPKQSLQPTTTMAGARTQLRRISSMPVLSRAVHRPSTHRFPSPQINTPSSQLTPPPSTSTEEPFQSYSDWSKNQGEPWTLRRTILLFEKAGNAPLIEGYRTDLQVWWPFLDAVARGQGKIMLCCEPEWHIKT